MSATYQQCKYCEGKGRITINNSKHSDDLIRCNRCLGTGVREEEDKKNWFLSMLGL